MQTQSSGGQSEQNGLWLIMDSLSAVGALDVGMHYHGCWFLPWAHSSGGQCWELPGVYR